MTKYSFFLILITAITLRAQTDLSGALGGMTLEMTGNPYIVSANITIAAGKKVTIGEGCVFLFKPYSGIIIEGSIEVQGSEEKPVIFTSINDSLFNPQSTQSPEPFDWNGFSISVQARNVQLSNFILSYSVYGVKSQIDDIIVKSGVFTNNGQFHFTIKDAIQPVTETVPFSYGIESPVTVLLQPKQKDNSALKRIASIALLTTGIAGLGGMGYSLCEIPKYHKKYDNAATQTLRNKYYDKQVFFRNTAIASGTTGIVLSSVGLTVLILNKSDNKHVTILPYQPEPHYSGICMQLYY